MVASSAFLKHTTSAFNDQLPNVVVPAYVANGDLDVVVVPSSDVAVYKLLPNAAHCVTRRLFALLGETVLAFRAGPSGQSLPLHCQGHCVAHRRPPSNLKKEESANYEHSVFYAHSAASLHGFRLAFLRALRMASHLTQWHALCACDALWCAPITRLISDPVRFSCELLLPCGARPRLAVLRGEMPGGGPAGGTWLCIRGGANGGGPPRNA